MSAVAAVIITHNEASNIARCLKALQGIASEILVVDSHSTDGTVDICEKMGVHTISREWQGYAKTKNFANEQVDAEWILSIDADEVLSDELRQSIKQLRPQRGTVYALDRINNFCGQWIRHGNWYPDWKPRLFHKQDCYWVGDFVHEKLKYPPGTTTSKLPGKLYHYTYHSLDDHWQRLEHYAQLAAEEMHQKGRNSNLLLVFLSATVRFVKAMVLRAGFLDGKNGWIIGWRHALFPWLKHKKWRNLK